MSPLPATCDPNLRHDFILLFDVLDGNPNGDPDAGNLPRVDPETMQGLVTDVALKRKVRNYVHATRGDEERYKIYVEEGSVLNHQHQRAYTALNLKSKGAKQDQKTRNQAKDWMCRNFYDVRTFGAVMSTGVNCGQVRGPVQLTFARSIDPILPLEVTITRVAITDESEKTAEEGTRATMGRKALVPYALFRAHGFFVPTFANKTSFNGEDLQLFWESLEQMWVLDRSASRGLTSCRALYLFTHDSALGKAPAHALFERVQVQKKEGVTAPRAFSDYRVQVAGEDLPEGVTLHRLVG